MNAAEMVGVACVLVGSSAWVGAANAAGPGPDPAALDIAKTMANCAGLFTAMAAVQKSVDKPANAERFRGLSGGWVLGAQYVMAIEAGARGVHKTLGNFENFTQPIVETESIRILALMENGDMADVEKAAKVCQEPKLVELQESIVTEFRTREN